MKARAEIFVVEQNFIYQDLDGTDYRSLHVYYEEDGTVLAYLRAFEKENMENTVQMGRVLSIEHGIGLGGKILQEGLKVIREKMNPMCIYIEAQCYAVGYYEKVGFKVCSEEFLEDGIPHMQMKLEFNV